MASSEAAALAAFVAPLGAVIGSFLNVVIHRLPLGQSVVAPRSQCPACKQPIRPLDNVPVLSWLALRGRCRHCDHPISLRYPLLELITAATFVSVALLRGVDSGLVLELPFAAVLIAVGAIDVEHRIVPNRIVVPAALYAIVGATGVMTEKLPELLAAGAGAFLGMLLIALAYPGGMGMGDVKLAGVIGLYLGISVVPALLIAFLSGTVVGLGMMAARGAAARKRAIPFGPFLALGALVGLLAGPELIDIYTDRLLS